MKTQGTQRLKKRNSSEVKYLIFHVLLHEWIFLWLLSKENTLEQVCLEVFALMG